MFNGNFQATIDDKGRLAVPSAIRRLVPDSVEPALYVVAFSEERFPHLKIFTQESFANLRAMIAAIEDPVDREDARLLYVAGAHGVNPDAQGRIALGAAKSMIGFEGSRAVLLGMDAMLYVYDEATFQARQAAARQNAAAKRLVQSL